MSVAARWWHPPALRGVRWPWQRGVDFESDHGHRPYAAWEAELSAYARLRAGVPIDVTFGLGYVVAWHDAIQLARPPAALDAHAAFTVAELALEHVLMHFRHGTRELALYWHTWSHPLDPVSLPWPPWDQVDLPGRIVRQALLEGVPGFAVPPAESSWPGRQRDAALWLASAWADGVHRAREVGERPGMAERLPLPAAPAGRAVWPHLLHALACGEASASGVAGEALALLRDANVDDVAEHTHAVIEVTALLARRGALPPAHKQRPAWLHPLWGRWRRAVALQRALAQFARSPTSAEMAAATARARTGRTLASPMGGRGALATGIERSGLARRRPGEPGADATQRHTIEANAEAADESQWGVTGEPALPNGQVATPNPVSEGEREGSGAHAVFGGTRGAGPGMLGALHVVEATASDRAAYWQLRGALAPEIERLVERLRAAGAQDNAAAPRRFQRAGRIDRNRFPAALSGRETVFVRFIHKPEPAHALCLLLDCSASMTSHVTQLRESAILVESAATAVGARVGAFLFGPSWERMEPPAVGAPLVALGRDLHPHGGTPFGAAAAAAAEWLSRQPFKQKRLWVFSDGQWSARDRAMDTWKPELLKDVVVWVFAEEAPEPPHPAMRVVAVPTLADLVQQAPAHFWPERSAATP